MANTISFSASLSLSGPGLQLLASGSLANIAQAGTDGIEATMATSVTTSTITIGAVTTIGYLFVKNMDAVDTIRIGLATPVSSGNAAVTLLPGEFCLLPTRQTVWYAIATANTPALLALAFEL
jgi:hypothetical protein